jgi:hypothetical protein
MLRPSVSRRFVAIAAATAVGTGIGFGAVGLWSVAGAATPAASLAETAASTGPTSTGPASTDASVPAGADASSPLTADQATAIAIQASPGRVIKVDADMETHDPNDPTDADDVNEANEPTGLRYDVTVLHDNGTATKVEVDAATGQVVSTKVDD